MDRKAKLLYGLDVAQQVGMELGALCRPTVRRADGRVIYVDHADTETLKRKYRDDPDVSIDEIVDVDVVWGAVPLAEATGERVDYVIASHVVEHVPDLISWLHELRSVLNEKGELRLIVPDRRFTFDRLRRETSLADVLYAQAVGARCPIPHIVLDYVANVVKVDPGGVWDGACDDKQLERHHSSRHAVACALQARDGIYHDVHCWVFTPHSFATLFAELVQQGIIDFECSRFYDTERGTIEFFVSLRPCADRGAAVNSWLNMASGCDTTLG